MADLKFTSTHEWLQVAQDDMIIGITDHAQQLLGDMVFIELPHAGQEVQAGQELGVVESVKAASDFYAPISGVVIAVNDAAADNLAEVEAAWAAEIEKRARRVIAGESAGVPWEDVRRRAEAELRKR